jgi:hypothetical protein
MFYYQQLKRDLLEKAAIWIYNEKMTRNRTRTRKRMRTRTRRRRM